VAALHFDLSTASDRIEKAQQHVQEMDNLIGDERRAAARAAQEKVLDAAYWLQVVQRDLAGEVA